METCPDFCIVFPYTAILHVTRPNKANSIASRVVVLPDPISPLNKEIPDLNVNSSFL